MRFAVKLLLGWFVFFGFAAGAWQMLAPTSFFNEFPGFGYFWVRVDGPFNEHLVRDVGQGNVAFGTVALVALLSGSVWAARGAGLAAVAANVPHQIYHQLHTHVLATPTDAVLQTITLTFVSVASIALALIAIRIPVEPFGPEPVSALAESRASAR
jgi:hypothetical protein